MFIHVHKDVHIYICICVYMHIYIFSTNTLISQRGKQNEANAAGFVCMDFVFSACIDRSGWLHV